MADRPCAGNILRIAGAVILPNLGGIYNGRLTRQHLQSWYANLKFPSFAAQLGLCADVDLLVRGNGLRLLPGVA